MECDQKINRNKNNNVYCAETSFLFFYRNIFEYQLKYSTNDTTRIFSGRKKAQEHFY